MKKLNKIISIITACCLLFSTSIKTYGKENKYWKTNITSPTYEYYGDSEGVLMNASKTKWSVLLTKIGWSSALSFQMHTSQIPHIQKGKKYQFHCVLNSSNVDKWIGIYVGEISMNKGTVSKYNVAYVKWIKLKKGKNKVVNEIFRAKTNANKISFCIGGEGGSDYLTQTDNSPVQNSPDNTHDKPTLISCSEFYFDSAIKKAALNTIKKNYNGIEIKLKKQKVDGYQIQYSTSKKFKKKNTKNIVVKKPNCIIKNLKNNKKYYFRVRCYKKVSKSKVYSKWSKIKVIQN